MSMMDQMTSREEDRATRAIEQRTSMVPSIGYLGLAIGSIAVSLGLMLSGRKAVANFVGQWAPTFLIIGLYNKLVKVEREVLGETRRTTH